ncbi:MAG: hypothetical protein MJE68_02560 [Proteobacteria bacterium]|nr:hypothetical protein [Pseudomonadota bacterium]
MVFKSALDDESKASKCNYLKFWLGEEALPLIQRWEDSNKVIYEGDSPNGDILDTYWDLLEVELKPQANRIVSIIDLWSNGCRQGETPLGEWVTTVYNKVEMCDYKDKDRIIRDILLTGCNSNQAKDRIIRKGEKVTLPQVLQILQTEDSTTQSLQNINSTPTTQQVHYARYDSRRKSAKPSNSTDGNSNEENSNSKRRCYRCGRSFTKGHMKKCPALKVECNYCHRIGHFEKCCNQKNKDSKDSSKETKKVYSLKETGTMYYDEDGQERMVFPIPEERE